MNIDKNALSQLIGQSIRSFWVGKDKNNIEYLKFISIDGKEFVYMLEADCCSVTFYDKQIDLSYVICDGKIRKVVEEITLINSIPDERHTRQDVDLVSQIIITAKLLSEYFYLSKDLYLSYGMILFRNSSNGFYSGSIGFVENSSLLLGKVQWRQVIP